MTPFLSYATEKKADIIALIRELVECESPTDSPEAVDRFVDLLIERTRDIASAKTVKSKSSGKHLRLEFKLPGRKKAGQILGLGHSDTVWPIGTLNTMPCRQAKGRLWGPGVLDMKSGLAFFIYAARALQALDVPVRYKAVLLVVSDEETGSRTSRAITEGEALQLAHAHA